MYFKISFVLHLMFMWNYANCALRPPPTINGSFYAVGELVTTSELESSGDAGESRQPVLQSIAFEETYDHQEALAAVEFQSAGMITRIVEDAALKKAFVYGNGDLLTPAMCTELTEEKWTDFGIEPKLKQFEVQNGVIVLPLRQLFILEKKGLADTPKPVTYRGVSAELWKFSTDNVIIEAYWSVGEWTSSSAYKAVPLGFKITRQEAGKEKVSYINIMEIQHDLVNKQLIQPIRGIYCEGRSSPYLFPKSVSELQQFSFSTEFVLKEKKMVTAIDTWVDFSSKLLKLDFDPMGRDTTIIKHHSFTQIISTNQGVVYEISKQMKQNCLIWKVAAETQDMQIFFDYRNASRWTGEGFFGSDVTNYVYVGEVEDMGIPCRLFHGIRTDFPYGTTGFQTLWEWCIEKRYTGGSERGFPAISLTIYFQKVNGSEGVKTKPVVQEGSSLTYHFYNVQQRILPIYGHKPVFDINNCLADSKRMDIALTIPVSDENREAVQEVVNNVFYVYKWIETVVKSSKTEPSSLRISNFRLTIGNTGDLGAFFTILEPHPDLPEEVFKKELDAKQIYFNINEDMQQGKLSVTNTMKEKDVTLKATKIANLSKQ